MSTPRRKVAQSVFILLAKKAWSLIGHPELAGWLYRAAVLEARQYLRSHQRRMQREQLAAAIATVMNSSEEPQFESELDEAMLELRAKDREALVLRYFSGKSVREVGEALGIREDAAQKRLRKALEALTACLRRRGLRVADRSHRAEPAECRFSLSGRGPGRPRSHPHQRSDHCGASALVWHRCRFRRQDYEPHENPDSRCLHRPGTRPDRV
jgi:RNA polymerase sigma factor (sigma-70 family)